MIKSDIKGKKYKIDVKMSRADNRIAKYTVIVFYVDNEGIHGKYRSRRRHANWISSGMFLWAEIEKIIRIPS